MTITRFAVQGLNQKLDASFTLHPDINILTGRNGSGKTTLLKLMWYMISGNLERIPPEISFDHAELESPSYSLSLAIKPGKRSRLLSYRWSTQEETISDSDIPIVDATNSLDALNHKVVKMAPGSVFFPTFRRIEGGFATNREQLDHFGSASGLGVQRAMASLARKLSVIDRAGGRYEHRFVASISTDDLVELLTKQYASVSERTNALHSDLSVYITNRIGKYSSRRKRSDAKSLEDAVAVLNGIQRRVAVASREREDLLRPFSILSRLITQVFQHQGISITEAITLGDATQAIASDRLSAGEKQMLSFLCYNAFTKGSPIFIDEPELSLHVDWQRSLFPLMLDQGTENQFIIATHSPFVYSRYSDKEHILDADRGE